MPHDVPVCPPTRYPRETGSTLFEPRLHFTIGCYTSVYIRKPVRWVWCDIFLNKKALTDIKLSVKIKHFSGGWIKKKTKPDSISCNSQNHHLSMSHLYERPLMSHLNVTINSSRGATTEYLDFWTPESAFCRVKDSDETLYQW
jgi:hypothetical protein